MKENELFDKVLDQVIDEASTLYLENEKSKEVNLQEESEQIKKEIGESSDILNYKMKKLFNTAKGDEARKSATKISKKVAVVAVCVVVISGILVTSVEAWRKEVVKFVMKNNDDNYMSIKFGNSDSGEELEENSNIYEDDEIKFMYLPEGFELKSKEIYTQMTYYNFANEETSICLARESLGNINKQLDIEQASNEKIDIDDKEVFKIVKNDRISFLWYDTEFAYIVSSNISEQETLKFIENTNKFKKLS